jgi:FtsH-binding integral membrane protein
MDLSIYGKVALLLTMSMSLGGFGCWVAQKLKSILAFIVLAVLFLAGAFFVPYFASVSTTAGITALAAWTFISGLFMGPAIHSYSEEIGWKTVALAFFGTAGVMALCGLVATFSGINFSGLGSFLGIALFGLIIVGIIRLFSNWGKEANILYSSLGVLIFAGYFLYDFFTLKHTENNWQRATELTMKFYLDFLNFLLHLLQLIAAAKHHS